MKYFFINKTAHMLVTLSDLNICTESCSHSTQIGKQKRTAILHHIAEEINKAPDVKSTFGYYHISETRVPLPLLLVIES